MSALTPGDREALTVAIACGYYDHTIDDKVAPVVERIVAEKVAAAKAEALREAADEIDGGPTFPLPPSVLSALLRDRADQIEGQR